MKKHFFFDMDNTITRSRSEISEQMSSALLKLIEKGADIVVVSGAKHEQMCSQLGRIAEESALLAQNGNHATASVGTFLWKHEFNWRQKMEIFELIYGIYKKQEDDVDDIFDIVEDRGCQISYSLIGHNADREKKEKADPDREIRKKIIWHNADDFAALNGVKYAIGGTTCIDFYLNDKGENVRAFMEHQKWIPEECVYVGDALFEGGNDASVIGVMDTRQVEDSAECLDLVKEFVKLMPKPEVEEDEDDEDNDDL